MIIKPRFCVIALALLVLVAFFFTACSSEKYSRPLAAVSGDIREAGVSTSGENLPWELWTSGKTLQGAVFRNENIIEGDELVTEGKRKRALELYSSVNQASLTPDEKEALVLRIAGTQLALEMSPKALSTMSAYFRTLGATEDSVNSRFALVFAYAYGHKNNVDQCLAWFARAAKGAKGEAGLAQSAQAGARLFLRTLSDEQITKLTEVWTTDSFVYALVGQERRRRAGQGFVATKRSGGVFWNVPRSTEGQAYSAGDVPGSVSSEQQQIGVILPLTGQYSQLGNSTKNGIELALKTVASGGVAQETSDPQIKALYRDDAGDSLQATVATKELLGQGVDVIIGPLLADAARQTGELVKQAGRSMITFSKNPDLITGEGVFRFGVTSRSQVTSLLEICQRIYSFSRYAIVFPDDVAGNEFADLFREGLRNMGLQAVVEQSYSRGDFMAFNSIAQAVEAAQVEAVFFPDNLKSAGRFFSAISSGARQKIVPLGTAAWDNQIELQQSRTVLGGAVFPTPFFAQSQRADVVSFVQMFEERFGHKPDFLAAQGFDAATLGLEALRSARANGITPMDALSRISAYEGVSGKVSVEPSGEIRRAYPVVALRDNKLVELDPETPLVVSNQGVVQ